MTKLILSQISLMEPIYRNNGMWSRNEDVSLRPRRIKVSSSFIFLLVQDSDFEQADLVGCSTNPNNLHVIEVGRLEEKIEQ